MKTSLCQFDSYSQEACSLLQKDLFLQKPVNMSSQYSIQSPLHAHHGNRVHRTSHHRWR